jgi:apoptosis-inducing factor 3
LHSLETDFLSEDAPAPAPIRSFKAEIKDGKVHVTADPEHTTKKGMSREPKVLSTAPASATSPGVVIVGGGSGAIHAIDSLREVRSLRETVAYTRTHLGR